MLPHHSLGVQVSSFVMIVVCGGFEVCPTNLCLTYSLFFGMQLVCITNFALGFSALSYDFEFFFLMWKCCLFKTQVGCGDWELGLGNA